MKTSQRKLARFFSSADLSLSASGGSESRVAVFDLRSALLLHLDAYLMRLDALLGQHRF